MTLRSQHICGGQGGGSGIDGTTAGIVDRSSYYRSTVVIPVANRERPLSALLRYPEVLKAAVVLKGRLTFFRSRIIFEIDRTSMHNLGTSKKERLFFSNSRRSFGDQAIRTPQIKLPREM